MISVMWERLTEKINMRKNGIFCGVSVNFLRLQMDVTETFKRSFDKALKFKQIYELIKCHREYVYNKDIPQSTYLVKGIKAKLSKAKQLPIMS